MKLRTVFFRGGDEVDRRLRAGSFRPAAPSALHGAIMQEVRREARRAESRPVGRIWGWLAVPATAVLVMIVLGQLRPAEPAASPLVPAAAALKFGNSIVQSAPHTALSPLTEEWERLNRDLGRTADFLLASLP
jgi:hypothetical protein